MFLSNIDDYRLFCEIRSPLGTNLGSESAKRRTRYNSDIVCLHECHRISLCVVGIQLELIVQRHVTCVGQYIGSKLNIEV